MQPESQMSNTCYYKGKTANIEASSLFVCLGNNLSAVKLFPTA